MFPLRYSISKFHCKHLSMFPTVCVCCREYTKLQELETAAKTSGAGKWCDNPPEDAVRSITWTVENLQHFVEKNHGQEING